MHKMMKVSLLNGKMSNYIPTLVTTLLQHDFHKSSQKFQEFQRLYFLYRLLFFTQNLKHAINLKIR